LYEIENKELNALSTEEDVKNIGLWKKQKKIKS
jgi:hypothetical protein